MRLTIKKSQLNSKHFRQSPRYLLFVMDCSRNPGNVPVKEGLYRIWCGVNRLGDSGVNRLGDTSAFVNPARQLLLTRRGKTRMDGVGIVFEFYIAPL